jgi:hypothetical protein
MSIRPRGLEPVPKQTRLTEAASGATLVGMRFTNDKDQSFDLTLSGYEPNAGEWLYVSGEANDGSRQWTFHEPCLTRRDVRDLADWLRAIADGKTYRFAIEFLEPNLAFGKVGGYESSVVIRVTFQMEARPPWSDGAQNDDAWLEFMLTQEQLRDASLDLLAQVEALESGRWPLGHPTALD